MKRFHYRLEPLLRIKSHHEKQRQKEHATALMQVLRQKEHLTEIEADRQTTIDHQRAISGGSVSAYRLQVATRYLLKLKRDTLTGEELLKGLERETERRRLRLLDATKEKKIFEKLKERQRDQFIAEFERAEMKELDEIATRAYVGRHRQR
jgi:flagellar protein FliJ